MEVMPMLFPEEAQAMEIITAGLSGAIGLLAGVASTLWWASVDNRRAMMAESLKNETRKLSSKREAVPEQLAPVAFTAHPGMTAAATTTARDQAKPFTRAEIEANRDRRNATYAAQRAASRLVGQPRGTSA